MAGVYSAQFLLGGLGAGGHTVGTVPADEVWILRDLTAVNGTPSTGLVIVNVTPAGGAAATVIARQLAATPDMAEWSGRIVLETGDAVLVQVGGATTTVYVTLSGYRLSTG